MQKKKIINELQDDELTPYIVGRYHMHMDMEDFMMNRTFIEVPLFTKRWREIGLNDEELSALQVMLLKDPQSGPVMEGTGGIRKVRFPLENKGKR